jgi:hypothetical protein
MVEWEHSQHTGRDTSSDANPARPKLTRVQIEALVSGDFAPIRLGPDLVNRLNYAWNRAGQRLHMLHVEIVNAPVRCPRCGDKALYRKDRRGFLQRKLLPFFRLYPWHCVSCRKTTLLRLRNAGQPETVVLPDADNKPAHRAA